MGSAISDIGISMSQRLCKLQVKPNVLFNANDYIGFYWKRTFESFSSCANLSGNPIHLKKVLPRAEPKKSKNKQDWNRFSIIARLAQELFNMLSTVFCHKLTLINNIFHNRPGRMSGDVVDVLCNVVPLIQLSWQSDHWMQSITDNSTSIKIRRSWWQGCWKMATDKSIIHACWAAAALNLQCVEERHLP